MVRNPNYHRDWQRKKAEDNPEWYEKRKEHRTAQRRQKKHDAVVRFGSKCSKCGGEFHDCVFEFHHIEPTTKEYSPAQLFMLSDEKINAELEKCILVCSNCHKLIHHEDNYKAHDKRKKYGSNN